MKKSTFNAQKARAISKGKEPKGLGALLKYIERHAKSEDETSCTIAAELVDGNGVELVKELKKLGFTASYVSDQRDGDYFQVSW
jgi:hypothetical protein